MDVNANIKKTPNNNILVIAALMVLSLLTGHVSQTMLSLGIVLCCAYLFFKDNLVLAFPFIIFYNEFYGKIFGLSVLRIFTLMLIVGLVLKMRNKEQIEIKYLIPVCVYSMFLLLTMTGVDIRRAIFAFVDVFCCLYLVTRIVKKEKLWREFFTIFVCVALCAFITGLFVVNILDLGSQYTYEYLRFLATFEDPNYMGFFYNIAIFSAITLKLFKPIIRTVLVIVLHMILLSSVSMTAILINIVAWGVYLVLANKIKIKIFIAIALFTVLVVNAYNYGLENPNTYVLGPVSYRIEEKLDAFSNNDINSVTSGRTAQLRNNWNYFKSSPIINRLFGGTSVNGIYVDPALEAASHNEYVDLFLNVGIIGAIAMFGYQIRSLLAIWKRYRDDHSSISMCMLMNKSLFLTYGLALTMFLDFRFMLFYLL